MTEEQLTKANVIRDHIKRVSGLIDMIELRNQDKAFANKEDDWMAKKLLDLDGALIGETALTAIENELYHRKHLLEAEFAAMGGKPEPEAQPMPTLTPGKWEPTMRIAYYKHGAGEIYQGWINRALNLCEWRLIDTMLGEDRQRPIPEDWL